MAIEDERAAVGFSVTLSGQLITASMATLTVEGAFVWYAMGSRLTRSGFIVFAGLTAFFIAVSIFMAGKGITKARNSGFNGNWNLREGKKEFNAQAVLLLIALATLAVTFSLSGPSKESALQKTVDELRAQVVLMNQALEAQPALRASEKKELAGQLANMSAEIEALRKALPPPKRRRP